MQNRRSAIIKKIIPSSAADVQVDRKRYLVSLFLAFGAIILLLFGIEDIVKANYLEGILESALGVSFGAVVLLLSRSTNNLWIYRLCTAAMTALFLFLILHETGAKLIMLWTLLLPPIAFYVLGKKEGLYWGVVISGLVFVSVIANPVFSGQRLYGTPMLMRFFSLYIVTALMSWVFEYLRNEYQEAAENERRELSIEKQRLSEAYDRIKELSITDT